MIDYSIFKENPLIVELVTDIDQLFLEQKQELIIQKTKDLIDYTYETTLLSNTLLYETHLYAAIMMLQSQQIKLFYHYMFSAQQYSRHKHTVQSLIYEAFVEPNLTQLQQNYEHNIQSLTRHNILKINYVPNFNNLRQWTLPTDEENHFYLYDKQENLLIKRIPIFNTIESEESITTDLFSDFLCYIDWEPNQLLNVTSAAKLRNKKAYIIINDVQKLFSSLQGNKLHLENLDHVVMFDHVDSFKHYFKHSSNYLPRNINEKILNEYKFSHVINTLHLHRLNNSAENHHNILLSIGIPTYNRGHRALSNIKHLLQLPYDYEVEFIISNNGTVNETKAYYDEIEAINDSRINYFSFDENQGFSNNFIKVCELARGQYILFISDEDLVDIQLLPAILDKLANQKETLAIMKTSTTTQSKWEDIKVTKGKEALKQFMLTSNYMSGHIFNRELIQKHGALEYMKLNQSNSVIYWYPHMYLELLLAQYGNIESISAVFIHEGNAEKTEFDQSGIGNDIIIPHYATIQNRLEQHNDFLKIISQLEINSQDLLWHRTMYLYLCNKTLFLTILSIETYYSKTDQNFKELITQAIYACSDKQQYLEYISSNHTHYENDANVIFELANDLLTQQFSF